MAEGSASQREWLRRFASLTREVPHQERVVRQPRVCVYFFIKDSRRQGGGDVCGRSSAKRGRQSSCHHVIARKVPQGIQPQQEELEGAVQATGSPKQLDPAQWVLDEETVLTLLKPRDAVFPEVSRSVESLKDRYHCCLLPCK